MHPGNLPSTSGNVTARQGLPREALVAGIARQPLALHLNDLQENSATGTARQALCLHP